MMFGVNGVTIEPAEEVAGRVRSRSLARRAWWQHVWRAVLLATIVFGATAGGLWLREKVWEWTNDIRFNFDIDNGFRWGKRANDEGYFSIYERLGKPDRDRERIDYAPFRLGLMTYWVSTLREHYPDNPPQQRQPTAEFHRVLLNFNTAMGLATAIGAFLVARHVARWRIPSVVEFAVRTDRAGDGSHGEPYEKALTPTLSRGYKGEGERRANAIPPPASVWIGTWIALLVAILTWLNPLILFNAHAWPQWDIWPMPFFIFALYCCLRRWWLAAGLIVGIGAGLKGQILTVGWVLPLFALFIGDWRGMFKVLIGIACSLAIIALPWAVSAWVPENTTPRAFDLMDRKLLWSGLILVVSQTLGFAMLMVLITRRIWPTTLALVFAGSVWFATYHLGGNDNWLQSSFGVGTWNYERMVMGMPSNLPAILRTYGYDNINEVLFTLPAYTLATFNTSTGPWPVTIGGNDVTMKSLLLTIFIALSVFCTVMGAIRFRQRDARAIVALCLPWAIFYAIPAQIHDRYLLFASACGAMFLVAGCGWFLLGLVFTILGFVATIHTSVNSSPARIEPNFFSAIPPLPWDHVPIELWGFVMYLCRGTHPGIAWGLLLAILVFLVGLCTSGRKRVELDDR